MMPKDNCLFLFKTELPDVNAYNDNDNSKEFVQMGTNKEKSFNEEDFLSKAYAELTEIDMWISRYELDIRNQKLKQHDNESSIPSPSDWIVKAEELVIECLEKRKEALRKCVEEVEINRVYNRKNHYFKPFICGDCLREIDELFERKGNWIIELLDSLL